MSLLQFGNITCIPSFHNSLQFAREVRKAFQTLLPDIVAIELPDIYTSDILQAVERLPRLSLLCISQQEGIYSYLPVFPNDSMIEGIRLARENHLPLALIDLAVENYTPAMIPFAAPDDEAIGPLGLESYYQTVLPYLPVSGPAGPDYLREEHMAARLHHLSTRYQKILFICGMNHWESIKSLLAKNHRKFHAHQLEGVASPFLAKLGPKARYALLEEIPYLVLHFELSRRFGLPYVRNSLLRKLLLEAREAPVFEEEGYTLRELQNILRYASRLALTDKRISPDLYNLLLACKQTLGDDFAIEVMDRALAYPYEDDAELPEIEFDPETASFLMGMRSITLQRRLPPPIASPKGKDWIDLKIVRKKTAELPQGYQPFWFFFGFFSHIPEDMILEGFIERLGDKLASQDASTEVRVQEFKGSFLDGIAMRETIRAHHLGKLYVKEEKTRLLPLGAWIMVFDEDLSEEKYPWMMSLSAEHHNESDIAFYASNPALHPVTREIIRAKYGAMLAFKPALPAEQKLGWDALDVDEQLRKEQLLRLAITHSPRPGVLYLANQPPDDYFYELARYRGKELYFLPISRISQRHLKRIQQFHLLSRREVRKIADDYI
ncbi:hypothetical protein COW36_04110 [bacterium (Candidatus Blackallbacteria) CG17_big_fil_post_rev_8_21_14_2_50_48_46]|uniref:Uncharacterized protein n=1 Tax=bacterium (Candidatus Blackallbacteria) CG17_big_fil_post_rev_8_21_14_2_50_48_46 TaxID=2014261 RepID=A0A2M7G8P3_9BACT|nr:MAG: hypothetical protein COW64_04835 [bacterium (Candidatus Blackallbacteria) CG18_big_fil_WC_8_21_14_2_50_49_26]PIW18482.1 MAG: hypothetical protein COW36_04110 [bacterium (Candidatus Blackallbacteria) CG17_big_fil_post_rev_8_21_14_2_50_48_46]PIW46533.1 MAG: hypothetical protein COW20_16570 [bacterium (Candidatus Blackallbacteria) CG13_big_fil_rev_8_21_14_2_50_49_14]